MYGLRNFWCHIQDEVGEPVTSGITISVSASSVYADEFKTALTANPFTDPTNGVVSFWTAAATVDIIVSTVDGGISIKRTLTPTADHRIVMPTHQNVLEKAMPPVEFFDDFMEPYVDADRWTLTDEDAGATAACVGERDGVMNLVTGGSQDDGATLHSTYENFLVDTDKNLFFEARIRVVEIDATNYDASWCVGLSSLSDAIMPDAAAAPNTTADQIIFFKLETNKFIEFETSNDTTKKSLSDMLAVTSGQWYRLGFKVDYNDGVTAKVTPYIDGVAYATQDLTISGLVAMHVVLSIKTHAAQLETLDVDYVRVLADRDD